jgi:hypothetical protein
VLAVACALSACGSGNSKRQVHPEGDAGADGAAPDASGSGSGKGVLQYFGSTVPAGGIVMKGDKYILFSVTGEVPGTSGLTKSDKHRMVGGIVGRASY